MASPLAILQSLQLLRDPDAARALVPAGERPDVALLRLCAAGQLVGGLCVQLGVRPDLGRDELTVVPQVPPHQPFVSGENIRLGDGALRSVEARRQGKRYVTEVDTGTAPLRRLTIGHTLPHGARPAAVFLDGRRHRAQVRQTNRGSEVTVRTRPGEHVLTVVAG